MTTIPPHDQARIPIAKTIVDDQPYDILPDEVLRERIRKLIAAEPPLPRWRRILTAPLTSVILAAILGAWLTHNYDTERLRTENELIKSRAEAERIQAQRDVELARAFATFEEVSRLLDKRLWRARRLAWASDEKATPEEVARRLNSYREAVAEWNENLNRNLALVERYFGRHARNQLEHDLAASFRTINTELTDPSVPTARLDARMNTLNRKIYVFNLRLLEMAQSGDVGILRRNR